MRCVCVATAILLSPRRRGSLTDIRRQILGKDIATGLGLLDKHFAASRALGFEDGDEVSVPNGDASGHLSGLKTFAQERDLGGGGSISVRNEKDVQEVIRLTR